MKVSTVQSAWLSSKGDPPRIAKMAGVWPYKPMVDAQKENKKTLNSKEWADPEDKICQTADVTISNKWN